MPFDFDPTPPDPFDRIDYLMNKPFRGLGMGRAAGPEYRRPLQPEEYSFLRDTLLGGGMSGLRALGSTLSAPGDYLRGAPSGNFGERKSGRDILDQLGATRKGDQGWLPWGAGLAADVVTDPLNLLTLGPKHAFTAAGKALSKLGPTEGGIQALSRVQRLKGFEGLESGLAGTAEQIRYAMQQNPKGIATAAQEAQVAGQLGRPLQVAEPLASLAKIQLPWGIGPQLNIGTGAGAQRIAGALDKTGDFLRFGNPVGRTIGSLLDPATQNTMGRVTQRGFALPGGGTDVEKAALARGKDVVEPLHREIEALLRAHPNDPAFEAELNRAINAIGERAPTSHLDPAIVALARSPGEKFGKIFEENLPIEKAAGSSTKDLQDFFGLRYTHRQALHGVPGEPLERLRSMPVHARYDIERNRNLINPGGTDRVNLWAEQGLTNPKLDLKAVQQQIYGDMMQDVQELKAAGTFKHPIDINLEKMLFLHAEDVAKELRKMKGMVGPGKHDPIFGQNPVELARSYLERSAGKQGALKAVFDSIGEAAVPAGTHPKDEAMPVWDLVKRLGLQGDVPRTVAQPITGGAVKALEALAPKGAPLASDLAKAVKTKRIVPGLYMPVPDIEPIKQALSQHEIPMAVAKEILGSPPVGQMPEQLKGIMGLGQSVTNLFRALAYPIWPASHVRNVGTAGINLLRTDTPLGAIKSGIEQWKLGRNPDFADPAVAAARRIQHAYGDVYSGFGPQSEVAGMNLAQKMNLGKRVTPELPGAYGLGPHGVSPTGTAIGDAAKLMLQEGLGGTIKNIGKTIGGIYQRPGDWREILSQNLGIKGVGGQTVDTLPAVASGWRFGQNIEDFFRGAQMRSLERQGYSPLMQGNLMKKYQFDYGPMGFTPFERNVMRQVFPFYGFMRKNIPLQLETLATRPGGIGAQTAPMMQNRTQPEQDYIPQYLQGNVAVPAGAPVDGKQQFFSTFGLPAEEAFGKIRPSSLQDTLMGFAANLNPMVKGPLEYLTDRQFFSGRQLSDLRPSSLVSSMTEAITGAGDPRRDQMLTQLLMNTPATRFLTTAQRLADPRKAWWQTALNLGTGVRVTDVDLDKQRAIETRDAILEAAGAMPHLAKHTSAYVPYQYQGMLRPDEIKLMQMQATYQQQATQYAEQKKRERLLGY